VGADGGGEEVIRLESEPIDKRFTLRRRHVYMYGCSMTLRLCCLMDEGS
jgi:hypothetical protein